MLVWPNATSEKDPSKTHSGGYNISVNLNHQGGRQNEVGNKSDVTHCICLEFSLDWFLN